MPVTHNATVSAVPPCSPDLEKTIIACVLLDGMDSLIQCFDGKINEHCFFDTRNCNIWKAIIWLNRNNKPITAEALHEEIARLGKMQDVGGITYIMEITAIVSTTAMLAYAITEVRQLYSMRELQKEAMATIEHCNTYNGSIEQFMEVQNRLINLHSSIDSQVTLSKAAENTLTLLDEIDSGKVQIDENAVSWGHPLLDSKLSKLRPTELIGIGARPGTGKSSLARLTAIDAALNKGKHVYFVSLEVDECELVQNMAVTMSGVPWKEYGGSGASDRSRFRKQVERIRDCKTMHLYCRDRTPEAICARARTLHACKKLDIVIIDHAHCLTFSATGDKRSDEKILDACKAFKMLAVDLKVPVVMLFQLNRLSDRENNREPKLSDAFGSSAIEWFCNKIVLIHRPSEDNNGITQDANDGSNSYYHTLIQAKGRNDGRNRLGYKFYGATTSFEFIC